MKGKRTTKASSNGERRPGNTAWTGVDALSDREIREAIRSDPEAAPVLSRTWFRRARIVVPGPKQPISLRLDPEVLEWFRRQGRGYQTRINAVLRAYVESQR